MRGLFIYSYGCALSVVSSGVLITCRFLLLAGFFTRFLVFVFSYVSAHYLRNQFLVPASLHERNVLLLGEAFRLLLQALYHKVRALVVPPVLSRTSLRMVATDSPLFSPGADLARATANLQQNSRDASLSDKTLPTVLPTYLFLTYNYMGAWVVSHSRRPTLELTAECSP